MYQEKKTIEKEQVVEQSIDTIASHDVQCGTKKKAQESESFSYWLEKNHYYHYRMKKFYRYAIPEGMRVLALQCKNGYLLDAVKPSYGVGVDTDLALISQAKETYGRHRFYHGTLADINEDMPFDYIVLSSMTGSVHDVQALFESLKPFCHSGTRILIDIYARSWQPLLWCAQKLGLARAERSKHWLSQEDIDHILYLTHYQQVHTSSFMLIPAYVPLLSTLLNIVLVHVPLFNRLCMHRAIVARPLFLRRDTQDYTVSVIIPCKNEKGTIESLVQRMPYMGKFTELLFVDGHSVDGTLQEVNRVIQKYPERSIALYTQKAKGRGDAVRLGFEYAIGDIVMILDADGTVSPDELPKFYNALVENKGECITGSRFVYSMERRAMRPINYVVSKFFGLFFTWLLGRRVRDPLCGTKVFWKDDYQMIARNRAFFGNFDPLGSFDLLLGAAKLHLKLTDIPVHYKSRRYGVTQIRRVYCMGMLFFMSLLAVKRYKFR